ncbi:MAG: DUF6037 family protein [Pelosinus sp.]|nr:DUF6037 family protein [Pelosinus sp.]
MIVLHGLRNLHNRMYAIQQDKIIFPYNVGRARLTIFFAAVTLPYELAITARADNIFLLYKIDEKYEVNPIMDNNNYQRLANLMRINGQSGNAFIPFRFFLELDRYIRSVHVGTAPSSQQIMAARPDLPEGEKTYFYRWYPHGGKVSEENVKKTRFVLGEDAAMLSLRHNMSSQWTDDLNKARNWR